MTTEEIMELRAEIGFVSPLQPMERGQEPWLLFSQRGVVEVALHVDDAFEALARGGVERDGERLPCAVVDVLPLQNAIQLRVRQPDRAVGFVPAGIA